MAKSPFSFVKHGLVGSIGLLLMMYSFEAIHWSQYRAATPGLSNFSGGVGQWLYVVGFTLGGTIVITVILAGIQGATDQ